ncbi:hypothetical protein [Oribacterium sp. WCC10]|uniref:hypothetical protein n=1 Tax=Oribacterium sp. WCC10 TaxID=1855343 RepID=UPI0008DF22ED|nr:hypothetical protein [Oribacterium sp. WCC10]SFG69002.1 hypothetical protein SAMN05216356_11940 [Oribacterium sp. WCC10]
MKNYAKTLLATAAIVGTMTVTSFAGVRHFDSYNSNYRNHHNRYTNCYQQYDCNGYYSHPEYSYRNNGRYHDTPCHNSFYSGSQSGRSYRGCY